MSEETLKRQLEGCLRVNENMKQRLDKADRIIASARMGEAHWQAAWEQVIADLGALLDEARARPKSKRHVSLRALSRLLANQQDNRAPDPSDVANAKPVEPAP